MPSNINLLKQADIFVQFSRSQIELVADICHEKKYAADEVIFLQGSQSDELYIIAQGTVDILIGPQPTPGLSQDEGELRITTLRRGQSFGEIALVDQGIRSATARAAEARTRLLIIPRDQLISLCDTYPDLGYRLMYNLATDLAMKLRSTDLRLREEILYHRKES